MGPGRLGVADVSCSEEVEGDDCEGAKVGSGGRSRVAGYGIPEDPSGSTLSPCSIISRTASAWVRCVQG